MTIERHISQYDNPQEFTRLCNAVFGAKYGNDYQVIDGSREDGGNDGLVKSEKRILAMFCPIKPEQRKDSYYLRKIRSDLAKAVALRDTGQYLVETWTFVTPRKMSNKVIAAMIAEGNAVGIVTVHKDAGFLALEISERPHILRGFPDLALFDAGEFIKTKCEQALKSGDPPKPQNPSSDGFVAPHEGEETEDSKRVMEIRHDVELGPVVARRELRAILYQSQDKETQLNAIFGITDLFAPESDDLSELFAACEMGLEISKSINSTDAEAVLRSTIGYWTSFKFGIQEIEYFGNVMADEAIGMNLFSAVEREACIQRNRTTASRFQHEFSTAAELAKKSGNPHVYVDVLIRFANAAGQRALYLLKFDEARGVQERDLCKKMLLGVKDFCLSIGLELLAANALFNLANHIRFFGEEGEAMLLLPKILATAEKFGDRRLMLKVGELERRIRSGDIWR